MLKSTGAFITIIGRVVQVPCMVIGSFLCVGVVFNKLGFLLGCAAVFAFPLAAAIVPVYAGFADGNWFPLILVYGGSIGGGLVVLLGSALEGA